MPGAMSQAEGGTAAREIAARAARSALRLRRPTFSDNA